MSANSTAGTIAEPPSGGSVPNAASDASPTFPFSFDTFMSTFSGWPGGALDGGADAHHDKSVTSGRTSGGTSGGTTDTTLDAFHLFNAAHPHSEGSGDDGGEDQKGSSDLGFLFDFTSAAAGDQGDAVRDSSSPGGHHQRHPVPFFMEVSDSTPDQGSGSGGPVNMPPDFSSFFFDSAHDAGGVPQATAEDYQSTPARTVAEQSTASSAATDQPGAEHAPNRPGTMSEYPKGDSSHRDGARSAPRAHVSTNGGSGSAAASGTWLAAPAPGGGGAERASPFAPPATVVAPAAEEGRELTLAEALAAATPPRLPFAVGDDRPPSVVTTVSGTHCSSEEEEEEEEERGGGEEARDEERHPAHRTTTTTTAAEVSQEKQQNEQSCETDQTEEAAAAAQRHPHRRHAEEERAPSATAKRPAQPQPPVANTVTGSVSKAEAAQQAASLPVGGKAAPQPPPSASARLPAAQPATVVEGGRRAPLVPSGLGHLFAESARVCSQSAALTAAESCPSAPAAASAAQPALPPSETSRADVSAPPAASATAVSDAVFCAQAAQLQRQSARLSEETARAAAAFQSQAGDLLRQLGPHPGLASLVDDRYAATPVVHLVPMLTALLEELLADDAVLDGAIVESDEDTEEEGEGEEEESGEGRGYQQHRRHNAQPQSPALTKG